MQTLTVKGAATLLESILSGIDDIAIALSGGIDSLVLTAVSHRVAKKNSATQCTAFHAVSAAVPEEATARVRACARDLNWNLQIIDSEEFADPNYRTNPINRCYYCKSALYGTINSITTATLLSGTNIDDLAEFRPGLKAAKEFNVRHPFVEAGINKTLIRQLSHLYGLPEFADLPAAPCLASRVETGISIEPDELRSVNAVEKFLSSKFLCQTIRCRLRAERVVIEADQSILPSLSHEFNQNPMFIEQIRLLLEGRFKSFPISVSGYQNGSAFVGSLPTGALQADEQ